MRTITFEADENVHNGFVFGARSRYPSISAYAISDSIGCVYYLIRANPNREISVGVKPNTKFDFDTEKLWKEKRKINTLEHSSV